MAICVDFNDFCNNLEKNKIILAPFCGAIPCEEKIKKLSARFVSSAFLYFRRMGTNNISGDTICVDSVVDESCLLLWKILLDDLMFTKEVRGSSLSCVWVALLDVCFTCVILSCTSDIC